MLDAGSWINKDYIPLKIEYRESSIEHLLALATKNPKQNTSDQ